MKVAVAFLLIASPVAAQECAANIKEKLVYSPCPASVIWAQSIVTKADAMYPALSQDDSESIRDFTSISEGMRRYSRNQSIMAKIWAAALGVAVCVRISRFFRGR